MHKSARSTQVITTAPNMSAPLNRLFFALQALSKSHPLKEPVPLILALAEPQNDVRHIDPLLLIHNLLSQPNLPTARDKVRRTYTSRAGGIEGLDLALCYLHDGGEDYVLVVGSDSHLGGAVERPGQTGAAAGTGDGFAPGEGAAFLLLTRHPEQALCRDGQY